MTATPHSGKPEDFQLFMALIDADRFEGKSGAKALDAQGLMTVDSLWEAWRVLLGLGPWRGRPPPRPATPPPWVTRPRRAAAPAR